MSEPPAPTPASAYILTAQLPCRRCRYDLNGLTTDKVCPECSLPIGDSFHDLRIFDLATLDRLQSSIRFATGAILISVLSIALLFVFALIAGPGTGPERTLQTLFLPALFIVLVVGPWIAARGWWLLGQHTSPIPIPGGGEILGIADVSLLPFRIGPITQVLSIALAVVASCSFFFILGTFDEKRSETWRIAAAASHVLWALRSYFGMHMIGAILRRSGPYGSIRTGGPVRWMLALLIMNGAVLMPISILVARRSPFPGAFRRSSIPLIDAADWLTVVAGLGGCFTTLLMLASLDAARRAVRDARLARQARGDRPPWEPLPTPAP